jgi:spore germination protein YaaH
MPDDAATGGTEQDPSGDDAPETPARHLAGRRRIAVFVGCALVTLAAALVLVLRPGGGDDDPEAATGLDAWAPYWALEDSLPEVERRSDELRELSPFWYAAEGVGSIVVDGNAPAAEVDAFLASARDAGARIVPSVVDAMPAGAMAALLADPAQRAGHVEALADFAAAGDFAGLDIDYEQFAFADDRSTWATTRPAWVAFVGELAERLHGDGRTLTVSIPPVYDTGRTQDSGYWVYDYAAIAPLVDRIRVMAYDFSTTEPGPIAPLDWVQEAIDGTVAASGDPGKLVLGIPAYGYNWVVGTTGTCPSGEETGRTGVTARTAPELAARRRAEPVYDEIVGEWAFTYQLELSDGVTSCTQTRQVRYVDGDGALARAALADEAGFGGSSLWALGYEDEAFWNGLADADTRGA